MVARPWSESTTRCRSRSTAKGDSGAIGPGTYEVTQSQDAGLAAVIQVSDYRSGTALETLSGGTVNVTTVGSSVAGDYSTSIFDVTHLRDGGQISGHFDVPFCQIHH